MVKQQLRRFLRAVAIRFPDLQRVSGRLGLGRLLAPASLREQLHVDGDVVVELDMSVPGFRYLYFHHDLSAEPETRLLQAMLRPTDVLVDVGANIGVLSLVAAKYAAHVHAFEISPGTAVYFRRNVALNPQLAAKITLHTVGLADRPGEMLLYNSVGQPDLASLQPLARDDAYTEIVQVTTLDAQLAGAPVTGLKIDVEGAELSVLKGASRYLTETHPWILVEMFEEFQRRFGASCAELDHFLTERGYSGYLLRSTKTGALGWQISALNLAQLDQIQVNNVLYITPEHLRLLPEGAIRG